ncbi:tetratricopeptide repeat protein [Microvirga thermotolerans]|uniref:Tetratricopeptide repeat protein n=1 Tax=Microvirga thermotolerans TaxID=2651334 RepID=A0A5P9JW07_9HYPH|nr:tetratricopeptide repeat protein [Microvirga thermotolerans]QFU15375.1 hypothetical protein GDR74_03585 [Microvirga thermotolerans]
MSAGIDRDVLLHVQGYSNTFVCLGERLSGLKALMYIMLRQYRIHLHLSRGRILYRSGRYNDAAKAFRAALRLNWRHESAALWIRRANEALEDYSLREGQFAPVNKSLPGKDLPADDFVAALP